MEHQASLRTSSARTSLQLLAQYDSSDGAELKPGLHLRLCALRQATPQALLATQVWKPQARPPPQTLRRTSSLAPHLKPCAASQSISQPVRPCAAPQALHSQSSLATTSGFAKHSRPCAAIPDPTHPLKPCAQKWQTAAPAARAARANATSRLRVAP